MEIPLVRQAWFKHKTTIHIAIILILPILLCLINDNWIFNPAPFLNTKQNTIDPWMYHSLFQRYSDLTLTMKNPFVTASNLYYMERIGWITVGYVIYHIFPALLANFILHLGVYYLGVFSLYALVRQFLSAETGLAAALVMGAYPWYLLSVGYDYLDGYNNSLFLFSLLCASFAILKNRSILMVIAGAVFAITISNNTTMAITFFAIGGIVVWLWWQDRQKLTVLLRAGVAFAVGAVLMLVVLAGLYYILTHEWNYMRFTSNFSSWYSGQLRTNPAFYAEGRNTVYRIDPFSLHVFPLLTALIATLRLSQPRKLSLRQLNFLKIIAILFAINYLSWAMLDFLLIPYLTIYLYASYMMPLTFLLFAAVIHSYTERFGLSHLYAVGLAVILSIPFAVAAFTNILTDGQSNKTLIVILTLAIALMLIFIRQHRALLLAISFGFAVLHILVTPYNSLYSPRGTGRESFVQIQGLLDAISEHYPSGSALTQAWGWFDYQLVLERYGFTPISTYTNLAMTFWWGRLMNLQTFFPTKSVDMVMILEAGQTVEEIQSRFKPYGYTLTVESTDNRVADYPVYFTRVTPIPIQNYEQRYRWYSADIPWYSTLSATGDVVTETGPSNLTTVDLELPPPDTDVLAEVCVVSAYTPDFQQKTQLRFNDKILNTEMIANQDCPFLFQGVIPAQWFKESETKRLGLAIDTVPIGDAFFTRQLGVTVAWVQFTQKAKITGYNPQLLHIGYS